MPINRQQASAGVARVEVKGLGHQRCVTNGDILNNTRMTRLKMGAPIFQIRAVSDEHIAAVAAASVEKPPGCGIFFNRGDHFQKTAAQRPQRIVQPIFANARIAKADRRCKDCCDQRFDLCEGPRNQRNLAQAQWVSVTIHTGTKPSADRAVLAQDRFPGC